MTGWSFLWMIAGALFALLAFAGTVWPFGAWVGVTLAVLLFWAWDSFRYYNS